MYYSLYKSDKRIFNGLNYESAWSMTAALLSVFILSNIKYVEITFHQNVSNFAALLRSSKVHNKTSDWLLEKL